MEEKEFIVKMIIDLLFESFEYIKLNKNYSKLELNTNNIDSKTLTYLLLKYDKERFEQKFIMEKKINREEN